MRPVIVVLTSSLILNFCLKVTFESHHDNCNENIGSTFSVGGIDGTIEPINSTLSFLSKIIFVDLGPPSGRLKPYKCQPWSTVTTNTKSPSLAEVISTLLFHFIGVFI